MKNLIVSVSTFIFLFLLLSCNDHGDINKDIQQYEGRIYAVIEDHIDKEEFTDGVYKFIFEEEESGHVFPVRIDEPQVHDYRAKSGFKIRMEATFSEETLHPINIQYLESRPSPEKVQKSKGNGGGPNKSMLVVMVSDSVSSPNCTMEDMEYQLVSISNPESTASLFTESSRGKFTIGSVSFEEVYIPAIRCQLGNIRKDVNPVLASQGVSIDAFDYIMYVTAPLCSYGGTAWLNGNSFHNAYCTWPVVSAHELGHCLGMHHSGAWTADGGMSYYGDPSCVMGVVHREINALHRIGVGWIGNKNIKSVKNSGSYELAPLEIDNTNDKQVLKIDVNMVNFNHAEQYYLSYRAPIGAFDDELSGDVVNKLSIHTWRGELGEITRFVGALAEGDTFTDLENGVQITNMGIIDERMTVIINFNPVT